MGIPVAPHGGAWIETLICATSGGSKLSSPLTEGRGLKPLGANDEEKNERVAPHGGAWIETSGREFLGTRRTCRPSRRGVD